MTAEALQIRFLQDLQCSFFEITVLSLNATGPQSQLQRIGYIVFAVDKQSSVSILNLKPYYHLNFLPNGIIYEFDFCLKYYRALFSYKTARWDK